MKQHKVNPSVAMKSLYNSVFYFALDRVDDYPWKDINHIYYVCRAGVAHILDSLGADDPV